jgi:hypothetical protein
MHAPSDGLGSTGGASRQRRRPSALVIRRRGDRRVVPRPRRYLLAVLARCKTRRQRPTQLARPTWSWPLHSLQVSGNWSAHRGRRLSERHSGRDDRNRVALIRLCAAVSVEPSRIETRVAGQNRVAGERCDARAAGGDRDPLTRHRQPVATAQDTEAEVRPLERGTTLACYPVHRPAPRVGRAQINNHERALNDPPQQAATSPHRHNTPATLNRQHPRRQPHRSRSKRRRDQHNREHEQAGDPHHPHIVAVTVLAGVRKLFASRDARNTNTPQPGPSRTSAVSATPRIPG